MVIRLTRRRAYRVRQAAAFDCRAPGMLAATGRRGSPESNQVRISRSGGH